MSDDEQVIVAIAVNDDEVDLATLWATIREQWKHTERWQRWVDADFPGAT